MSHSKMLRRYIWSFSRQTNVKNLQQKQTKGAAQNLQRGVTHQRLLLGIAADYVTVTSVLIRTVSGCAGSTSPWVGTVVWMQERFVSAQAETLSHFIW